MKKKHCDTARNILCSHSNLNSFRSRNYGIHFSVSTIFFSFIYYLFTATYYSIKNQQQKKIHLKGEKHLLFLVLFTWQVRISVIHSTILLADHSESAYTKCIFI